MPGELLVAVSGVSDRTLADLDDFRRCLEKRSVPLSLLVAPRRKHDYRLEADPATVAWLRRQRAAGDALVLHGFDEAATKARRSEFAVLPAHEANLRLIAADRIMEQVGLRTRIFAAPGWTASAGTLQVLPRNGFRLMIGARETVDLVRGRSDHSRLLGIGGGFHTEPRWCRTLVLAAERTARRGGTVRLAITAKQLRRPGPRQAVLDAIESALMHGAIPAVYRPLPLAVVAIPPSTGMIAPLM